MRDNHFFAAGQVLRESAKNLTVQFDERKFAKTVRELKLFVDKMPYLQKMRTAQANHTSMLELVRQYTDREEYHELLFVSFLSFLIRFLMNFIFPRLKMNY